MSEFSEDDYKRLKRKVDEAKEAANRAQGALDQLMERLKTDFECDDLKSAKRHLAGLEEKQANLAAEFDKKVRAYEAKWV